MLLVVASLFVRCVCCFVFCYRFLFVCSLLLVCVACWVVALLVCFWVVALLVGSLLCYLLIVGRCFVFWVVSLLVGCCFVCWVVALGRSWVVCLLLWVIIGSFVSCIVGFGLFVLLVGSLLWLLCFFVCCFALLVCRSLFVRLLA